MGFIPISISERISDPYDMAPGQTEAPVPFPFQRDDDLIVRKTLAGVTTDLALGLDYHCSGAGLASGGKVIFETPMTGNEIVQVIGEIVLERTLSVVRNGRFASEAMDYDFARLWMGFQEFRRFVDGREDALERALRLFDGDTEPGGRFNARGNKLENLIPSTDPSAAATYGQLLALQEPGEANESTTYQTKDFAELQTIDDSVQSIVTRGRTVAGVGHTLWKRITPAPSPAKAWHLVSANGKAFVHASDLVTVDQFASADEAALAAFTLSKPLLLLSGTAKLIIKAADVADDDKARHAHLMKAAVWQQSCLFTFPAAAVWLEIEDYFRVAAHAPAGFDKPVVYARGNGPKFLIRSASQAEIIMTSIAYGTRVGDVYPVTVGVASPIPAYVVPGCAVGHRCVSSSAKDADDAEALSGGVIVETIAVDRLSYTGRFMCPRVVDLVSPLNGNILTGAIHSQSASRAVFSRGCLAWNTDFSDGDEVTHAYDGVTTNWPYNFFIADTEALEVFVTHDDDTVTVLPKNQWTHKPTGWAIVGVGDNARDGGGAWVNPHHVTYTLSAGDTITIRRLLDVWTGTADEAYFCIQEAASAKFANLACSWLGVAGGAKGQELIHSRTTSFVEVESCAFAGAGDQVLRSYAGNFYLNHFFGGGGPNGAREILTLQGHAAAQLVRTNMGGVELYCVSVGDHSSLNGSNGIFCSASRAIYLTAVKASASLNSNNELSGARISACAIGVFAAFGWAHVGNVEINRTALGLIWQAGGFIHGMPLFTDVTSHADGPEQTWHKGGAWITSEADSLMPDRGRLTQVVDGSKITWTILSGSAGRFWLHSAISPKTVFWEVVIDALAGGTPPFLSLHKGSDTQEGNGSNAIAFDANDGDATVNVFDSGSGVYKIEFLNELGATHNIRWVRMVGDIDVGVPVVTAS